MVDKGNLYEVAIEIKIAATTKLTDALISSNAGLSFFKINVFGFGFMYWLEINLWLYSGISFKTFDWIFEADLTKNLDMKFGLNLSIVSSWFDKSIEVLITDFALLDVQSVIIIMAPAPSNISVGAATFSDSISIV